MRRGDDVAAYAQGCRCRCSDDVGVPHGPSLGTLAIYSETIKTVKRNLAFSSTQGPEP